MASGLLEDILATVTDEEKKKFDGALGYLMPGKQLDLRVKSFEGFAGGAEDLAAGVYAHVKKYAQSKSLVGKTDRDTLASILEQFVITALDQMPSEDAKIQAKIFKARLAAGEFGSADERIQSLAGYAQKHLGMDQKIIGGFIGALKSGNPDSFYGGLRQMADALTQSAVSLTSSEKLERAIAGKEYKFNAYVVQRLREDYGVDPVKPLEALETGSGLTSLRKLWQRKDEIDGDLKPYTP